MGVDEELELKGDEVKRGVVKFGKKENRRRSEVKIRRWMVWNNFRVRMWVIAVFFMLLLYRFGGLCWVYLRSGWIVDRFGEAFLFFSSLVFLRFRKEVLFRS